MLQLLIPAAISNIVICGEFMNPQYIAYWTLHKIFLHQEKKKTSNTGAQEYLLLWNLIFILENILEKLFVYKS